MTQPETALESAAGGFSCVGLQRTASAWAGGWTYEKLVDRWVPGLLPPCSAAGTSLQLTGEGT